MKAKKRKIKNPVARCLRTFNKHAVHVDRLQACKRGYRKHTGKDDFKIANLIVILKSSLLTFSKLIYSTNIK